MAIIRGIVIPCDMEKEPYLVQYEQGSYKKIQAMVGGTFDVIDTINPEASLFFHDSGKTLGLPVNVRATRFLYLAHMVFRNRDIIVGDVLMAGVPDYNGATTSVPDELEKLILNSPSGYKVEVMTHEDLWTTWGSPTAWYANYWSALRAALILLETDAFALEVRVVSA